jgi:parvulin-like peptidyl-prolyl isomerase
MPQNKKFIAQKEKEERQKKIIIYSTIAVLVIVIGLVVYGVIDRYVLKARTDVIELESQSITVSEFDQYVRWTRRNIIIEIDQILATFQQLGSSPEMFAYFEQQLIASTTQLQDPILVGQEVIRILSDEIIMRVEAEKLGIDVDDEMIDQELQEAFGYFENGTPTPLPTAEVPDSMATQQAEQNTDTVDEADDQEPDPTATPILVPTEYTEEMFNDNYQQFLLSLNDAGVVEATIRDIVKMSLIRQEITNLVTADLDQTQEQVWIRHILVEAEETALEVLEELENGTDFVDLAAEYSIDESNKNNGGDLGWFGRGRMVPAFEEAAFGLEMGEISPPVQTDFGWHILESLGKEDRLLDPATFDQLKTETFNDWLNEKRTEHQPTIYPEWGKYVPSEPNLPAEYLSYIQQLTSSEPQLPIVTPEEQE